MSNDGLFDGFDPSDFDSFHQDQPAPADPGAVTLTGARPDADIEDLERDVNAKGGAAVAAEVPVEARGAPAADTGCYNCDVVGTCAKHGRQRAAASAGPLPHGFARTALPVTLDAALSDAEARLLIESWRDAVDHGRHDEATDLLNDLGLAGVLREPPPLPGPMCPGCRKPILATDAFRSSEKRPKYHASCWPFKRETCRVSAQEVAAALGAEVVASPPAIVLAANAALPKRPRTKANAICHRRLAVGECGYRYSEHVEAGGGPAGCGDCVFVGASKRAPAPSRSPTLAEMAEAIGPAGVARAVAQANEMLSVAPGAITALRVEPTGPSPSASLSGPSTGAPAPLARSGESGPTSIPGSPEATPVAVEPTSVARGSVTNALPPAGGVAMGSDGPATSTSGPAPEPEPTCGPGFVSAGHPSTGGGALARAVVPPPTSVSLLSAAGPGASRVEAGPVATPQAAAEREPGDDSDEPRSVSHEFSDEQVQDLVTRGIIRVEGSEPPLATLRDLRDELADYFDELDRQEAARAQAAADDDAAGYREVALRFAWEPRTVHDADWVARIVFELQERRARRAAAFKDADARDAAALRRLAWRFEPALRRVLEEQIAATRGRKKNPPKSIQLEEGKLGKREQPSGPRHERRMGAVEDLAMWCEAHEPDPGACMPPTDPEELRKWKGGKFGKWKFHYDLKAIVAEVMPKIAAAVDAAIDAAPREAGASDNDAALRRELTPQIAARLLPPGLEWAEAGREEVYLTSDLRVAGQPRKHAHKSMNLTKLGRAGIAGALPAGDEDEQEENEE